MGEVEEKTIGLIQWLTLYRPKLVPYSSSETPRYIRIIDGNKSAYCFIVRADFETKTLGDLKAGDLLYPAAFSAPAKKVRGSLFSPDGWDKIFGEWGMERLNKGRSDIFKHATKGEGSRPRKKLTVDD